MGLWESVDVDWGEGAGEPPPRALCPWELSTRAAGTPPSLPSLPQAKLTQLCARLNAELDPEQREEFNESPIGYEGYTAAVACPMYLDLLLIRCAEGYYRSVPQVRAAFRSERFSAAQPAPRGARPLPRHRAS